MNKNVRMAEFAGAQQNRPRSKTLMTFIKKSLIIEGKDALAEEFDVSITTIERWVREGVPREKIGRCSDWYFNRVTVAQWRRKNQGLD